MVEPEPPHVRLEDHEVPPTRDSHSAYGLRTLAVDGSVIMLMMISAAAHHETAEALTLVGLFVAAPISHLAHGNPRGAAYSLGLRVLAPIGGFFAGAYVASREDSSDSISVGMGAGAGAILGLLVGMATDWIVVSRKRIRPASDRGGRRRAAIVPILTPGPNAVHAGLGGVF